MKDVEINVKKNLHNLTRIFGFRVNFVEISSISYNKIAKLDYELGRVLCLYNLISGIFEDLLWFLPLQTTGCLRLPALLVCVDL